MMSEDKDLYHENINKILQRLQTQLDELDSDDSYELEGIPIQDLENAYKDVKPKLDLKYRIDNVDSIPPKYNYGSDSGFDLYSVEDVS